MLHLQKKGLFTEMNKIFLIKNDAKAVRVIFTAVTITAASTIANDTYQFVEPVVGFNSLN
jgi:hypothetical protein